MEKYVSELKRNYAEQLAQAAFDYLHIGLSIFYDHIYRSEYVNPQVALGNLAIAVELMLKAFIARKSLLLLFKGLPLETRALLTSSKSLPTNFKWRVSDIELKSATDKIIDLGECVALLFIFFPDLKQPLKSHLDLLVSARNASVHSILPSFQKYELERAAYVALKLFNALNAASALPVGFQRDDEDDEKFLTSFQESRLERVQEKMKQSKENAKRLPSERVSVPMDSLIAQDPFDYWARFIIRCPICSNDAVLEGYTDTVTTEADENGPEETLLGFFPDRFHCDFCKLNLEDYDELQLAGIKSMYEKDDDVEVFKNDMKRLAEIEGWDE